MYRKKEPYHALMVKREPRFGGPPPGAHNVDNGTLYMIAYQAANKITAPLREGGENEALVSVAFSVISLESFLNEARDFSAYLSDPVGTSAVTMFRRVMADLEQSSIAIKYAVSQLVLTGKAA